MPAPMRSPRIFDEKKNKDAAVSSTYYTWRRRQDIGEELNISPEKCLRKAFVRATRPKLLCAGPINIKLLSLIKQTCPDEIIVATDTMVPLLRSS